MKRKIIGILAAVLVFTALSTSNVFAEYNVDQREKSAISSMLEAMRNWSLKAQEEGELTEEEAKEWEKHLEIMEQCIESNGFGGGCGGFNNGNGNTENQNFTRGNRNSMMRGFAIKGV